MNMSCGPVTIRTFGATLARGLRTRACSTSYRVDCRTYTSTHWNRVSILCLHYVGFGPQSAQPDGEEVRNDDRVNGSSDDLCSFASRARAGRETSRTDACAPGQRRCWRARNVRAVAAAPSASRLHSGCPEFRCVPRVAPDGLAVDPNSPHAARTFVARPLRGPRAAEY